MATTGTSRTTAPRGAPAAGSRRQAPLRPFVLWLGAAVLALSACSTQPTPRAPGTPPPGLSAPVVLEINQSRDQYGQQAILLLLTNRTDGPVMVVAARVRSPLFDTEIEGALQGGRVELPPGQPKSVPARLPAPACTEETSTEQASTASALASATVSFATGSSPSPGQGKELTLRAPDPFGVLARNNAELCLARDVAAAAGIALAPDLELAADGRTAVVHLLISPRQPGAGPGAPPLTLQSIGGTPLLAEAGNGPWPRNVTFTPGEPAVSLALGVRPARCDPHAVAEDKVGTLLPLAVAIGTRHGILKVPAGTALRGQLYDFVTSACAAG